MTDINIKKLASLMGHVLRPTSFGSQPFPKANFLIVRKMKKLIILFFRHNPSPHIVLFDVCVES